MSLKRKYRHLARYREIANALAKQGFGYLLERFDLRDLLSWKQPRERLSERLGVPRRIFLVLEELGPTFIKLGQILSTRPDLVPRPILEELEKLQDEVPSFGADIVEQVIKAELGKPVGELFIDFVAQPFASASIGQVHLARLPNGEQVVVKVQRPHIEQTVETDLDILFDLARVVQNRTEWGQLYRLVDIVEEFAQSLRAELDYTQEGRNTDRFWHGFQDDPNVYIPRIFWDYSSRRVLVLEYVEGIKISNQEQLRKSGFDLSRVAKNVVEAMFRQIYEFGFFHSDPHPGNLAVLSGERILFMDFGQVGRIDREMKEKTMDLVLGMVRYDSDAVVKSLLNIGVVSHKVNIAGLKKDVARLQEKYYGLPLSQIQLGAAMRELMDVSFTYRIRVPAEFTLLMKSLLTLEGLVKQLDPTVSLFDLAEPLAKKIMRNRYAPGKLRKILQENLLEISAIARSLPRRLDKLLTQIENGDLKLELEHRNLPRYFLRLNAVANRISMSILLASLIIGSSLLAQRSSTSILGGFPIAEIGYLIAALMGLWLVVSIFRSGRF